MEVLRPREEREDYYMNNKSKITELGGTDDLFLFLLKFPILVRQSKEKSGYNQH